jgi:hypothetical protein
MVSGLKASEIGSPSGADPHVWGWVAGGGLEIMPLPQWVIRGEFLHADMTSKFLANDLFATLVEPVTVTEHNINIFRVGISYYLGADKGIVSGVSSKY